MKEVPRGSPVGSKENFPKKAARFVLKNGVRVLPASVLIFAACSGGGGGEKSSNFQELENKASSGYSLPFPQGETWYLTTGPHGDNNSAIDIAPPEVVNCAPGVRIDLKNRTVTASASGEVALVGNANDRNDPFHSVVDIKDNNGLTVRYAHLDKIPPKVKLGNKVKQGDPLGNPSCEYPPDGANTGIHVHVGLMKGGLAIPIDGVKIGGWTIHGNGTMTKDGEQTRTANTGRHGENSTGIRNDLPNNSNKAVVAGPKDPIPPISGKINEKSTTPTPKPTETPKPVVENKISISKNPEDLYRTLASAPLNKHLPSGMTVIGNPTAVSPSDIHNNFARAFGAEIQPFSGGNIFISIDDERTNIVKGQGFPNGTITLTVYPTNQDAVAAFNQSVKPNQQTRALQNFPYPSVIEGPTYGTYSTTAYIENVVIGFTMSGNDMKAVEQRTIELMRSIPKLLQNAGN